MSYIGNTPFTAAFLTDTFSGDGSDTTFTLSAAPANTSSIIVAVSGVLQDPSTYSVSGTTLTFSAAPPSGTDNISVRFLGIPASGVTTTAYRTVTEFTATAGQTSFSVPSYTVGYVDVYRNGVMLGTADFTASSGTTIVLASGATAGDLIRVESFYVSSVLNAIQATAGAVNSTYIADSAVTTAKIDDAAVTQAKLGSVYQNAGPAFSAYRTSSQSLSSGTWTKVQFNNESFDPTNNYDPTTNYRFTPNVAGYYLFNFTGKIDSNPTRVILSIAKNGNYGDNRIADVNASFTGSLMLSGSRLYYMNGSTDYVEAYVWASIASPVFGFDDGTVFTGILVRAA